MSAENIIETITNELYDLFGAVSDPEDRKYMTKLHKDCNKQLKKLEKLKKTELLAQEKFNKEYNKLSIWDTDWITIKYGSAVKLELKNVWLKHDRAKMKYNNEEAYFKHRCGSHLKKLKEQNRQIKKELKHKKQITTFVRRTAYDLNRVVTANQNKVNQHHVNYYNQMGTAINRYAQVYNRQVERIRQKDPRYKKTLRVYSTSLTSWLGPRPR